MDQLSDDMLRIFDSVLDGQSFTDVGAKVGWSRQRVHRRVRALATELQRVVGVVGVDEGTVPTLTGLVAHRDAYREALEHYDPTRAPPSPGRVAMIPDDAHLSALLAAADRGRVPLRDRALLMVLFATAAKPSEIAGLAISDYLAADGSVRRTSQLRTSVAYNGKRRVLYLGNERLCAAVDAYLAERCNQGHGVRASRFYRGLEPASPLFLRQDGEPFGKSSQSAASALQHLYHKLFHAVGVPGLSTFGVRRAVARRLHRQGYSERAINTLLGLGCDDSLDRLLGRPAQPIGTAMEGIF